MLHTIAFAKASGAGNDFVLIDNMNGALQVNASPLAAALCSRGFGVGADGLLMLESSDKADFFMRYFNADGSYGGMCGNGGRCAARYAFLKGIAGRTMRFEALDYIYDAEVDGSSVRLRMKNPSEVSRGTPLEVAAGKFTVDVVNTGSPHAVVFQDGLETLDVEALGRQIRWHAQFSPEGSNVDFIRLRDHAVDVRTYERGVEGETSACGTGAVASAIVAAREGGLDSPVHVRVRSGEELLVHFVRDEGAFRRIILEGSAHMIFAGHLIYDDERSTVSLPTV